MVSKKTTTDDEYATDEEVIAAVRALSDTDNIRVGRVASFRARALAGSALGQSADDLMQEAIARTLNGSRRWRRSVTFVTHLTRTIRSIANHAADELKGGLVLFATSNEATSPLDSLPTLTTGADGERVASANEQLAKIGERFADDPEAGLVLEGLATGMTGPEIQQDLQITQTKYETIMTRLRRGMDRKQGWRL